MVLELGGKGSRKKIIFLVVWSLRGRRGVILLPRKINFLGLYLSYFKTKKVLFASKLERGGGNALVATPLKKNFFCGFP